LCTNLHETILICSIHLHKSPICYDHKLLATRSRLRCGFWTNLFWHYLQCSRHGAAEFAPWRPRCGIVSTKPQESSHHLHCGPIVKNAIEKPPRSRDGVSTDFLWSEMQGPSGGLSDVRCSIKGFKVFVKKCYASFYGSHCCQTKDLVRTVQYKSG
jgi:hypothetical protein